MADSSESASRTFRTAPPELSVDSSPVAKHTRLRARRLPPSPLIPPPPPQSNGHLPLSAVATTSSSDEETVDDILMPSQGDLGAPIELNQVVELSERHEEFRESPISTFQRERRPPAEWPLGPSEMDRARRDRQQRVADEIELRSQPWYRFAQEVAGLAGIPLQQLISVNEEPRKRHRPLPSLLVPVAATFGLPSVRGGEGEEESEGFGSGPSTPTKRRQSPAVEEEPPLQRSRANGSAINWFDPPPTSQQQFQQEEALGWIGQPSVTGVHFLTEIYSGNLTAALSQVLSSSPPLAESLEQLSEQDQLIIFTSCPNTVIRNAFATVVAMLISTSYFYSGRRPQRATDYERYIDRLNANLFVFLSVTYDDRELVLNRGRRAATSLYQRRLGSAPTPYVEQWWPRKRRVVDGRQTLLQPLAYY